MFLEFIRKASSTLSLLAATCTYAQTEIRCPTIDNIHKIAQKIEFAVEYSNRYQAYTTIDIFTENKRGWEVFVNNITANSHAEAIAKGKETVQKTALKKQEYATEINHDKFVSCAYGPGDIFAYGHLLTV